MKKSESEHMERVSKLSCVACDDFPVQVHHMRGFKRNNWLVIPLCVQCHLGAFSIHMDRRNFENTFGSELMLLAKTIEALHGQL